MQQLLQTIPIAITFWWLFKIMKGRLHKAATHVEWTKGTASCSCALAVVEQFRLNQCFAKDVS